MRALTSPSCSGVNGGSFAAATARRALHEQLQGTADRSWRLWPGPHAGHGRCARQRLEKHDVSADPLLPGSEGPAQSSI